MVEAASAKLIRRAIIIGALGYFIDVFDIQLFNVLRLSSLTDLGITPERQSVISGYILNAQMSGMIVGGFVWGWLGDRFGRLRALYGSILIYSIFTLLCSTVHDPLTYGIYRLLAGFGLAGECGAAVTLVAELMPAAKRSWGIIIMAGFAFLGPVAAVGISLLFDWRTTYIIAGVLGLLLLVLRKTLTEPLLFTKLAGEAIRNPFRLLAQRESLITLFWCLMMGMPLAYLWNFLALFSVEISHSIVDDATFNPKFALLAFYIGTSFGDIVAGFVTKAWQNRRKTVGVFIAAGLIVSLSLLLGGSSIKLSGPVFCLGYFLLGVCGGFWILMTTIAAEHFGTNVRATTSSVVTNLTRGFTIPLVFAIQMLKPIVGIDTGAAILAMVIFPVALFALTRLRETHGTDLDYLETI